MKNDVWTITNKDGRATKRVFVKNREKRVRRIQPQELIPFTDEEMEIYCEEGCEDIFCKDMYELYTFVQGYETSAREQIIRDLCPEISDEMLKMALECFAIVERKNLSIATDQKLSRKELRRQDRENNNLTFPF